MAVFTSLNDSDIRETLGRYEVGSLLSFSPISSGIENTNYFVDTLLHGQKCTWVLTLFENLQSLELPYFVELTQLLAAQGLCVPSPVPDRSGQSIFRIREKLGVLVPRIPGKALTRPRQQHVAQLGRWLGQMHQALRACQLRRPAPRNLAWFSARTEQLLPFVSEADQSLLRWLRARLETWMAHLDDCPKGLIHGDLFRDNVLFKSGEISGVIDFYHSCHAPLVFDLAVTINDWGYEAAFVRAYQSVRPLQPIELESLPVARIMAAWSFWLSRLLTKHLSGYQSSVSAGEVIKDPDQMKRKVQYLLTHSSVKSVMNSI